MLMSADQFRDWLIQMDTPCQVIGGSRLYDIENVVRFLLHKETVGMNKPIIGMNKLINIFITHLLVYRKVGLRLYRDDWGNYSYFTL